MMRWNWHRRGNTRDVVRRRGRVDLERVGAGRDPHAHASREGLAPREAAHGGAIIVAHRLFRGDCGENPEQERGRDDATGYHDPYGAGDLAVGRCEERFALRRTDCGCQLSVPAARISRAAALCRFARA